MPAGSAARQGKDIPRRRIALTAVLVLAVVGVALMVVVFTDPADILDSMGRYWKALGDRDRIEKFVGSFGVAAPLIFMAVQVLQVVLAPIPGEATGFVGGYLFGVTAGFVYSTVALTIGSLINFYIGRFLGRRFVRRFVPEEKFAYLDRLVRRQGVLVVLALFILPGFPKDYLCLFLGLSTMPLRLFVPLVFLGRMPGTLMLSLQGGLLARDDMFLFFLILSLCALVLAVLYGFRNTIYGWIEKIDSSDQQAVDRKPD